MMLHLLLLLSGIYIGGVAVIFLDVYLRNVSEVFGDSEVGRNIEMESYTHSFAWPLGVIAIVAMGRKKAGEALGFDRDRRELRRMFEAQEKTIEEADKILSSSTELTNSLHKSLLSQSDVLTAIVDIGTRCDACSGAVVEALSRGLASEQPASTLPTSAEVATTAALVSEHVDAHYQKHKAFYDELHEEHRVTTHVRCVERFDPEIDCRKYATYADPGRAIPTMCDEHRDDDSVLVGEMRMEDRPASELRD